MAWIIGLACLLGLVAALYGSHLLSYSLLKDRVIQGRRWGLNVCCGRTDGGGVNADVHVHCRLPNLVLVDVYDLLFERAAFEQVLCSHTLEHVEDPRAFYRELQRVGAEVTLLLPPLWDLSAVLNVLEHRWIFLTFFKVHHDLPPHIRLPLASFVQDLFGQRIRA